MLLLWSCDYPKLVIGKVTASKEQHALGALLQRLADRGVIWLNAFMTKPKPPTPNDFPPGSTFVIKEFDVPLVHIPGQGWFNWFGGTPRPYNPKWLKLDNNWPPETFEAWVTLIANSL